LIKNQDYLTYTDIRCGKTRLRTYSRNPVRIVRARKTLELLSGKHGAVDIFELFMSPILSPIVYL
jgi:hypothetical protein